MTGQTLLDYMELFDAELQNQSAEADVTRSLLALNIAQDQFELNASRFPELFGGATGTVTTSASTETTSFPSGVMRIDALQFIDPSTSRPSYDLRPRFGAGSHTHTGFASWPLVTFVTSTTGKPTAFWTNGTNIYWDPLPDATHTVRYYGFSSKTDITAGGTFLYPDSAAMSFAQFAVKVLSAGVGDIDLEAVSQQTFIPVLSALDKFNRTGARGLVYRYNREF